MFVIKATKKANLYMYQILPKYPNKINPIITLIPLYIPEELKDDPGSAQIDTHPALAIEELAAAGAIATGVAGVHVEAGFEAEDRLDAAAHVLDTAEAQVRGHQQVGRHLLQRARARLVVLVGQPGADAAFELHGRGLGRGGSRQAQHGKDESGANGAQGLSPELHGYALTGAWNGHVDVTGC